MREGDAARRAPKKRKPKLDLSREYGIVLEGGGARGSYQIGVWRALSDAGIRIRGISGASVGALNGALMCQKDLLRAEKLWSSIRYEEVLSGTEKLLSALSAARGKEKRTELFGILEGGGALDVLHEASAFIRDGGFDIAPLKKLIAGNIDPEKIRESDREFYVVTFDLEKKRELTIDMRKLPAEEIGDMLLASAYLPVFQQEKLLGRHFLDGGILNSVPVDVLLERGYEHIIVIRIGGIGITRPVHAKKGTKLYEVAPEDDLGGLLEFEKGRARSNMRLGYFDGLRLLYGLYGSLYYFDCDKAEASCLDFSRMEELGKALSLDRFHIWKPQAFIRALRRADEERQKTGEASVFLEDSCKSGFLGRILKGTIGKSDRSHHGIKK